MEFLPKNLQFTNNILTDFDQLLLNQKDLSNQALSLNDKLKYLTNKFIFMIK